MTLATHRFNSQPKQVTEQADRGRRIRQLKDKRFRIYETEADGPDTMALWFEQRYLPDERQHRSIDELIRFGGKLNPRKTAEFALLDQLELPLRTAVTDGGALLAVFLPAIPEGCMVRAAGGSARKQGAAGDQLFRATHLATDDSVVGPITDLQRWSLLATLAEVLASMHAAGLVHGWLDEPSVLCKRTADDYPLTAYLRNCTDAYLVDDERPTVPIASDRLDAIRDPYTREAQEVSTATDVYLFARWILQLFGGERGVAVREADLLEFLDHCGKTLGPQLTDLVRSALGPADSRPAALDFVVPLAEQFDAASAAEPETVTKVLP